ncbi:MAG: pyruvate dehydrogenase, partial [Gammaproteobacteria bacterium]|nr:pyruvate dehydrogenase [Gammaproteobacteria bacterium]NIR98023.1 pyruvate dehydrogenase [Gammaproteobacteria bacterium]NIT63730.1 pyruvate dehydrogenase [Gammaproteobacteria bacterium]NIV19905.1 pyruvate dehydrogenase [Gammaproteobacteria bacterium]NIX11394.1 pyruvate dehydrogenase [Gammaproteobacteria bacterium]
MSEPYTIKMPQLSDTMTEGTVVSWEKGLGDKVERGDIVATVETDKAIMDVEVFREGYLSGPLAPADTTVPVGEAIGYLVGSAEEVGAGEAGSPAEVEAAPATGAPGEPAGLVYTVKMPQLSDTMTEG